MATRKALYVSVSDGSQDAPLASVDVAALGMPSVYGASGALLNAPKLWAGTATTTSGVATFNPTADGTGSGAALFGTVAAVHATAEANTATMTSVPHAALKAVSGSKQAVTINVTVGTVLGVLGATILAAPDGTVTHLLLVGT